MKKSRLLEIIKEEITSVLKEISTIDVPGDPSRMSRQQKQAQLNTARSKGDRTLGTASNPVEFVEEDLLNETPYIDSDPGKRGWELYSAIKNAAERIKDENPEYTPEDISKVILSKKRRPDMAPEVEDALTDQEEKYGGGKEIYTPNLGGPQTLRAVQKALKDYTPKGTGKTTKEEPKKAEPKKPEAKKPEAKKPEAKKPEAKKPEAKKEEPKPSAKDSKLGNKKDELVKAKRKLEDERKKVVQGLNAAKGKEREDIVAKLKELAGKLGTVNKAIDKL